MRRTATAAVLVATAMIAATAARQAPAARVQALEQAIEHELSSRGGVGATVAIVENGRPLLARAFGRRSVGGPPPGAHTLFGMGSVTKQFTSAAVLLLAQDGRLAVDDKVAKYYPGLTRANAITLLDLMNHVSGYPDYYPLDFVTRRMAKPIDQDALLRQYAGGPLDFDPGTRWSYSNTGYILLGRIIEKVSGRPLGAVLHDRIFEPLGMADTVFDPQAGDPRVAPGYTSFALTPLVPATREGDGWVGGAGAIYSTASDIARWDVALMEGRVLQPASWAVMSRARILANGQSSRYGCGLTIGSRNGLTVYTHGGAVSGFIARNTFVPEKRAAVVVVINDEDGPLANAIVDRAMDAVLPAAELPVTTGPSSAREDRGAIPTVDGLDPGAEAKAQFAALQAGRLDRARLGEEYSAFVTEAKLGAASRALKPFGAPTGATVRSVGERGGMEVSAVQLAFGARSLDALMYRSPDGRVQEYLLFRP
jgi:D-alanyl-D-alanine carboxypeptidase